jgi:hypothetical protein
MAKQDMGKPDGQHIQPEINRLQRPSGRDWGNGAMAIKKGLRTPSRNSQGTESDKGDYRSLLIFNGASLRHRTP